MRRNWATGTMACVGLWAASGCAPTVDGSTAVLRSEFAACITDGGGTVAEDFELAVVSGKAVATVGPGVDAGDALRERCFDAVNG
jgi:hypothetical protein